MSTIKFCIVDDQLEAISQYEYLRTIGLARLKKPLCCKTIFYKCKSCSQHFTSVKAAINWSPGLKKSIDRCSRKWKRLVAIMIELRNLILNQNWCFTNFRILLLQRKNVLQGEIFSQCLPHKNTCNVMLVATVKIFFADITPITPIFPYE